MNTRLLYVMDPMCSWCWGFAPVLQALAEQARKAGVEVHLLMGGLRREQSTLDQTTRERIVQHWQAVEASTGQPFDYHRGLPEGLVYDTEPACRALVAARQLHAGKAWQLALLIQKAFYCEGVDVGRPAELHRLAAAAGLPVKKFADTFDAAETRAATRDDFDRAADLGISGFPTLLAQHAGRSALLTNGYQPLEALQPLLTRWLDNLPA
jgi:putative protein-disulfide isomerase